jgi:trehalose-6-phosphate synthase
VVEPAVIEAAILVNPYDPDSVAAAIAQALGCTDRTVRNRRRRLVTKLQELSAADA